jgi:hypothetical protein
MNINSTVQRFGALARELGCQVDWHLAQTRTVYLTLYHERLSRPLTVRIADHADAHGTSDYTIDGLEGTPPGARVWLLAQLQTTEQAVRRVRRARRSHKRREEARGKGAIPLLNLSRGQLVVRLRTDALAIHESGEAFTSGEVPRPLNNEELAEAQSVWHRLMPRANPL